MELNFEKKTKYVIKKKSDLNKNIINISSALNLNACSLKLDLGLEWHLFTFFFLHENVKQSYIRVKCDPEEKMSQ